jgi:hypothetical protein
MRDIRSLHYFRSGAAFDQPAAPKLYQGSVVLSEGGGSSTSFVVANFTGAQLRCLPTDGRHNGHAKSVIWLKHVSRRSS